MIDRARPDNVTDFEVEPKTEVVVFTDAVATLSAEPAEIVAEETAPAPTSESARVTAPPGSGRVSPTEVLTHRTTYARGEEASASGCAGGQQRKKSRPSGMLKR